MLKSTFKKVSAIAIAGTMLAGMMAVPANAMTAVPKTEKVTTTVINENFNGYEVATYNKLSYGDPVAFDQNSNIQFHHYHTAGYTQNKRVAIQQVEEGNNAFAISGHVGMWLNFDSPNGAPTTVNEGDIVTVSFKYKYEEAIKKQNIRVKLNDNAKTAYFPKEGGTSVATNGGYAWKVGSDKYAENRGRLVRIVGGNGWCISDKNDYGQFTTVPDKWYTMKITINTADAKYEGKQTIKVESEYTGGNGYQYGLFDADYNGSDDTEIDRITSIESLQFDTFDYGSANDGLLTIDDLNVSVTGDRVVDYDYVSDLSKTLVDEDFSGLTYNKSGAQWDSNKATLTGTVFNLSRYGNGGQDTSGYPDATAGEKAFMYVTTSDQDHYPVLYSTQNETLTKGDVLNISFDYYQTENAVLYIDLLDNSIAYKAIKNFYGINQGTNDLGDGWYAPKEAGRLAEGGFKSKSRNVFAPITGHWGSNSAVTTFGTNQWYTIEISINTEDAENKNLQTLSVRYKNKGSNEYIQEFLGYLDSDINTEGVQPLTAFKGFKIGMNSQKIALSAYVDNVKAEIVKPGFEVKDVDNQGNTYTFSSTAPIDLNYLVDASANSKVVIAQYAEGGRMIDATTEDLDATGAGTVTVTPVEGAQTIKLMVLDMSTAVPYAKVFKLTKSGN